MANGTFNLAEFYRQMGIKNPVPDVREYVQPVMIVGDFSSLCPQHRVPTALFGGLQAAVAGEFSFFQVTARARGGCVLDNLMNVIVTTPVDIRFAIRGRIAGATAIPDRGPLSFQPSSAIYEKGTQVADPQPGDMPTTAFVDFGQIYIPPGETMCFSSRINNLGMQLSMKVFDIPAHEAEPS